MHPTSAGPLNRLFVIVIAATAILICALHAPTDAFAGGYDVTACDLSVAGGANNSWMPVADNGMTAFSDCPGGRGITARTVYDNGRTVFLQGAYMIFDAPPGTSIDAVGFEAGWERADCNFSVGVAQSDRDLGGSYIWSQTGQDNNCRFGSTPGERSFVPNYRWQLPVHGTRLRLESRCGSWAGCSREGISGARLRNVKVHVNDSVLPTLSNDRGGLWTSSGWVSGRQAVGFDAQDGSGISRTSIRVDGKEIANRLNACDFTQRAPCPQSGMDETPVTAAFSDGRHSLTLSAVDSAGNEATTSHDVLIDNTAPDPPQDIVLDGGDGWRSANDFTMHWTPPASTGAPVVAAVWEFCPPVGVCTRGTRAVGADATLKDLTVPSAGDWTMRLWFRDAAGNEDERLAAAPLKLRFDDVSPNLAFDPLSADDPTLVTVQTSDQGSGVASGQIDVRKLGNASWRPLSTTVDGTRLVARIDDEHMSDGSYELRAQATDQAGNQRTTALLASGASAHFTLPLRLATRLNVGIVWRHGRRTRVVRQASVRYGTLVRVRGRLVTPEGNPLQDVSVEALSQVADGSAPQRLLATVRTSRTGRFSFLVRRGPSRTVVVRYGGTGQIRGVTHQLHLNVRAATSIRLDRHRVVNGEDVRFLGRIRTGRIPSKGKLVEMQVFVRGKWRTFVTTRARRRGTWRYQYRFDGTRGTQDYRFRAKLPPEASYPFAAGVSHVVRVRVSGG